MSSLHSVQWLVITVGLWIQSLGFESTIYLFQGSIARFEVHRSLYFFRVCVYVGIRAADYEGCIRDMQGFNSRSFELFSATVPVVPLRGLPQNHMNWIQSKLHNSFVRVFNNIIHSPLLPFLDVQPRCSMFQLFILSSRLYTECTSDLQWSCIGGWQIGRHCEPVSVAFLMYNFQFFMHASDIKSNGLATSGGYTTLWMASLHVSSTTMLYTFSCVMLVLYALLKTLSFPLHTIVTIQFNSIQYNILYAHIYGRPINYC